MDFIFIFKLLVWHLGLLVAFSFCYAVYIACVNVSRFREFKRKLKGVPIVPGDYIFGTQFYRYIAASQNSLNITNDHKKYGKSFAFMFGSVPGVATMDLDIIKKVVIDEANIHTARVSPKGFPNDEYAIDNLLLVEGEQWRRLRRTFAPAFTSLKFKAPTVHQDFEKSVELLDEGIAKRLEGHDDIILDGEDIFQRYFLDLIFRIIFKQASKIDFMAEKETWTHHMETGSKELKHRMIVACLAFPILRNIVKIIATRVTSIGWVGVQLTEIVRDLTKNSIEARKIIEGGGPVTEERVQLANGSFYKRGLMDFVIDKVQDGRLTLREYSHTTIMLFFAASKESADGLCKFIYLLAKHPEVQEKLRKSIALEGVESEYLNWCMNEALRLFPPAIGGASRKIDADVEVNDVFIPKGSYILSSAFNIHRSKEYWGEDAEEYKPERWSEAKSFHPVQFQAFGAGKRNCLGKDLASYAIKMVACRLLPKYKFEYVPGPNDAMSFSAPYLIFCSFDGPTYMRVSRVPS